MEGDKIKVSSYTIKFSSHAKEEMLNDEFGEALNEGEVIEEYPKDRPYPSYLMYGKTNKGRPLHIVCAVIKKEKTLVIITVYHPNPELWFHYRRRKI